MVIILIIVGILVFIISFLCFLYDDSGLQLHHERECDGLTQRIKFETFAAMYEMNPANWKCNKYICMYQPTSTECFEFSFSTIDYFKWQNFLLNLKIEKQKKIDCEKTAKYLEYFKKDIAAYEEKHKKETEKKLKEIWETNEKYVVVKDDKEGLRIVKNRYWNSK